MKILVTGAVDSSAANATTLHLFSLADFWSKAGHEVRLIVPEPSLEKIAYPLEGKNFLVETHVSAKKWGLPNTISSLLHIPFILKTAWRKKYDVIYVRMSILSFIPLCFFRLFTNAVIVTEHNGWVPDEGRLRGHPKFMQWLETLFQSWDGQIAHLTRAVSPETRLKLIETGCKADRVFIGENGTDIERMRPLDRTEALTVFNLDSKKKYIGFLGNLAYWQGVHILIDSLAICLEGHPEWEVLIAGDGIERAQLEAQAKEKGIYERMHFLGSVALDKANTVVNCFDIAVAPFIRERNVKTGCSPIKIRDYAGAGRAVISSNIPAVSKHSSTDWLVLHEPDNVEEFAQKMALLMADDTKRSEMGKIARVYAEKNYSWENVASVVIDEVNKSREMG